MDWESIEKKEWGNVIWAAQLYQGVLEDAIDEALGDYVDKIDFDYYDHSIEIMVKHDLQIKPELFSTLAEYGITRGWINFSDGTEMYFSGSKPNERKAVSHPRWTEEKRAKE